MLFSPNNLINENQLFEHIQAEIVEVIVQQKQIIEKKFQEKMDDTLNLTFQLRKNFLRELHLLRETYFMEQKNDIDHDTACKHSKTHLFNFDEGLDDQICELLTIKIKQVAQEYHSLMRD